MEREINSDFSDITLDIRRFINSKKTAPKINAKVISTNYKDNQIVIEFSKTNYLNKGSTIFVNDTLALVLYSNGKEAYLKIKSNNLSPGDFIEIDNDLTRIILKRLEKTLDKIDENDLNSSSQKILNFLIEKEKPKYNDSILKDISTNLNESQRVSVEKAINAQDFHLIIGPPGTGKTHVIKEIINHFFLKKQKILVTAWTNIAVDNILERMNDLNKNRVLRVGSKKEINSDNLKYTLFNKRKSHANWYEVMDIEHEISYKQKEMEKMFNELSLIEKEIIPFENKKKQYETVLSNIKNTINEFETIKDSMGELKYEKNPELIEIDQEIQELTQFSEKYLDAAWSVYEVETLEKNLPDTDNFYMVEGELKKLKGKGLVKKISSIFDKKSYSEYNEKLKLTQENYQKMAEEYNNYWDLKDLSQEKLKFCYENDTGKPDEDALLSELELCKKFNKQFLLKKRNINHYLQSEKEELLLKSYQIYIESLENKQLLIKGEMSQLKAEVSSIYQRKKYLTQIINNLQEQLTNLKVDKKELIDIIDEDILSKTNFIFSTVISSAGYLLRDIHFDVMIMDEASQVPSHMALIPLIKCNKFILVGDDKQLQPILDKELSEKQNQSIFNNLLGKYPNSYTFLDTQYRMNGQIADIASDIFYNNKLKTHPSIELQKLEFELEGEIKDIIDPDKPITFIDTSPIKFYEDGTGKGCKNTKEALIISKLVSYFISNGIYAEDIGIITPFVKQKEKLKELIEENVEVDTVYRFQGREKEIIIMSFCKSKIGALGKYMKKFIEQPTQINVAITRARKKLIIVGNVKTLQESRLLRKLIKSIGKESILRCNEEHLKLLKLDLDENKKEKI